MSASIYERAREYGYANARIRAIKPSLLSRQTLDSLCEVGTVDAMLEILQGTAYGPHIDRHRTRYSGFMLVSRAVMSRFANFVAKVERMVPDSGSDLLYVATGRFELYNLKLLFLEAMRGSTGAEYIEAGRFKGRRLEQLRTVRDVGILRRIVRDYGYRISHSSESYVEIVDDLEKSYYENIARLKDMCGPGEQELRHYIEKLIDFKNFDLALRKGDSAPLMHGGQVPVDKVMRTAGKGPQPLAELFGIADLYDKCSGDLSWLEELYDRRVIEWVMRAGSANPFSMCGIVGFVRRMDVERRNVRSIAVAKGVLTPSEIKERIIW